MDPFARRPFEDSRVLLRTAPFMLVTLLAFAAAPVGPGDSDPLALAAAAAATAGIAAAIAWVPWRALPARAQTVPVLAYFVVIMLLREGSGGNASGYAPLVLLPVIWLIVYGGRAELATAIAGVGLTLFAPLMLRPELAHGGDWRRAVLSTAVAALAGGILQQLLNDVLSRLHAEQRERGRRLVEALEEDRRRVARELHDEIGQDLTALVLQLERLARTSSDGATRGALEDAREDARASLEDVRVIARRLRPEALDELGLGTALEALADRLAEHTGLPIVPRVEDGLPPLDEDAQLAIFRVAQEGITNALRHAGPSQVVVGLGRDGARVVLTVTDDGDGIPTRAPAGLGVRGMRERADYVGGRLSLDRRAGGGTELRLAVPAPDGVPA